MGLSLSLSASTNPRADLGSLFTHLYLRCHAYYFTTSLFPRNSLPCGHTARCFRRRFRRRPRHVPLSARGVRTCSFSRVIGALHAASYASGSPLDGPSSRLTRPLARFASPRVHLDGCPAVPAEPVNHGRTRPYASRRSGFQGEWELLERDGHRWRRVWRAWLCLCAADFAGSSGRRSAPEAAAVLGGGGGGSRGYEVRIVVILQGSARSMTSGCRLLDRRPLAAAITSPLSTR